MTQKMKTSVDIEKNLMKEAMKGNVKPGSIKIVLKKDEPTNVKSINKKKP